MKEVRGSYFPGGIGVSDRAGGSDDSEVGFGGIDGALDLVRCGDGGGSEGGKAKAGAGRKAKDGKKGMHKGVCVKRVAVVTVVSWGRWWWAHWERWRRRQRRGMGGKARYI